MRQHVPVLPVYLSTRNVDKSIMNKNSCQRLLACFPIYKYAASQLSEKEKTYRRKEVLYYTFIHVNPLKSTVFRPPTCFGQLLHNCMSILLNDIKQLSQQTIHAMDASGKLYPMRVFLLAVTADGSEVAKLTMSGTDNCPCCSVTNRELSRTDVAIQIRSGEEVRW